ncbi:MAG: M20/M25/M40 family metallo-hydrolase, partial [Verrucomicrobia bacterium]|nr:M20/M25/M40 family metallo-hydrolase [Verrucomicrobiota bacterium]
ELVALPSVNPAFAPRDPTGSAAPRFGEKNVADFLASLAGRAGLDVEFQPVLPERSNVIARLAPRATARQTIVLAPHLDTVNGDDSQFVPRLKNGRLHGRGACDTKGSVAAMFTALCELAAGRSRPAQTEIIFAGLVDEENAQAGSRAFAKGRFHPRDRSHSLLAIVGEPTRLRVVTAHKGSAWLQIETRGKAAHGATPEFGKNAIHEMARVVEALQGDYAAGLRRKSHPLLGHATVNVGAIHGGAQPNIVPDHCAIMLDRRTLPGESDAGARREIAAFLRGRKLAARVSGQKAAPARPLETEPGLPLVRRFLESAGWKRPAGAHFFCDAAVLAAGKIPSVVFGPGDVAQAHTADEWIAAEGLERAKNLLVTFLRSLG